MKCRQCGTCCVAPDISSLGKPVSSRCIHLGEDNLCLNYDCRPEVCRGYRPDELCLQIAASTLEERVKRYLAAFDI